VVSGYPKTGKARSYQGKKRRKESDNQYRLYSERVCNLGPSYNDRGKVAKVFSRVGHRFDSEKKIVYFHLQVTFRQAGNPAKMLSSGHRLLFVQFRGIMRQAAVLKKIKPMSKLIKGSYRNTGLTGLVSQIMATLTRLPIYFKYKPLNCAHYITLRAGTSDIPTYHQVFIKKEYAFRTSKMPAVIVDAGANIGLASILFANRFPKAKIIAIEPEKSNFELLRKNTACYPNIVALRAALWNKNEEISLIDPGFGHWGFITEQKNGRHAGKELVPAITIDRVMTEFGLEEISILKIDIEGAEKEVFSDSSAWIDKVDSIIIELHERMKSGCNRAFANGSPGFANRWQRGENIYLSKGLITPAK
jgi:FkbM family methyltransferase